MQEVKGLSVFKNKILKKFYEQLANYQVKPRVLSKYFIST